MALTVHSHAMLCGDAGDLAGSPVDHVIATRLYILPIFSLLYAIVVTLDIVMYTNILFIMDLYVYYIFSLRSKILFLHTVLDLQTACLNSL